MKDVAYFDLDGCDLAEFAALTARRLSPSEVPLRARTSSERAGLRCPVAVRGAGRSGSPAARFWPNGPPSSARSAGVLVLRSACPDPAVIDAATTLYDRIIADEKAATGGKADHFAKAGANDRIWNSLQKLCEADPKVFALYFGNAAIAAVCEAWLGPAYQMTAQVNLVRPGGGGTDGASRLPPGLPDGRGRRALPGPCPRSVGRDDASGGRRALRHACGKRADEAAAVQPALPGRLHGLSPRPTSRRSSRQHCVQLPLAKGDAVFFNPALFHAGGREPVGRHPAHGEPPPGLLGHGPRDGGGRPRGRCAAGSIPRSGRCSAEGRIGEAATRRRHRRRGRGLFLPHQPRPRSARRRARAGNAGGAVPPRACART